MSLTAWHITWGTYGTRLHGDDRPTVDRRHNTPGTPFLFPNPARMHFEERVRAGPEVLLTKEQQRFAEATVPTLCERGGWNLIECAAGPNHIHVVVECPSSVHGKVARKWLKRWLGEALTSNWASTAPQTSWWAEGGSNRPIQDRDYFHNARRYVAAQRATPR